MADDEKEREDKKKYFRFKYEFILSSPRNEELDEGVIHFRWYFSNDTKDDGIQPLANGPRIRWLVFKTAIENPGMFFYSVNEEDLEISPMTGRPRIGPYAPTIATPDSVTLTVEVKQARRRTVEAFEKKLEAIVTKPKKNNAVHCRWYFTDMKRGSDRDDVITCADTQPVRDLFIEYLVKYPNQFWVSTDAHDLVHRLIDGIQRLQQGSPLPTVQGSNIVWSPGSATAPSATAPSAAASTSTARTGPTPTPSPTVKKKLRSGTRNTKPVNVIYDFSALESRSSAGTGPTHRPPGKSKTKPSSTVSVAPVSPPATTTSGQDIAKSKPSSTVSVAPVGPPATTTSGQDMAQADTLRTFISSFDPYTDSSPEDTDTSLSAAANPIPSSYVDPDSSAQVIPPDSGIAGTSSEETVPGMDPSEAQPIDEFNWKQFLNVDAVPAQPGIEGQDNQEEVVPNLFDIDKLLKEKDDNEDDLF